LNILVKTETLAKRLNKFLIVILSLFNKQSSSNKKHFLDQNLHTDIDFIKTAFIKLMPFTLGFILVAMFLATNIASGQVSTIQAWTNVYHNTSTFQQNITYTVPTGSNARRLLVIGIASSRTNVGPRTVTLTYGGQTLTSLAGDIATATVRQHTQFYYLNEAGLDAATSATLSARVSNGTTRVTDIFAAVFDDVNQSSPITNSRTYSSGTSTTTNPVFSTALTVNANDQAIELISSMLLGSTVPRTITYATNWTMVNEQTWTTTDGVRNAIANRSIPASNTTDVSSTTLSGSSLASMTGISIKAAPTPSFSGLTASQTICPGTATITLSGTVSAIGPIYPANDEIVGVTIHGVTQNATIAGGVGGFSINFNTSAIPFSATPYTITYSYGGNANLKAAANNTSTALTVTSETITNTSPGSRCGTGTVALSASASAGTINWYSALTGGSFLGSGTSFTTPSISTTTTYYVDVTSNGCTSSPRTAIIAYIGTQPTVTAGGGGTFCDTQDVNLTSSGTNITNQYWTGPNGYYSISANPTISSATSANSGTYTVTASSLSGINLIVNGDFEAGNTSFSSSYGYVTPIANALYPEGVYTVVANPNSVHTGFTDCIDHTPIGTMQMVVNGNTTAGVDVWKQTVAVVPNTDYQFTYWVQSVVASNPSQLQLFVNGISAGPTYTAITATCQWTQFDYNWNSGSNTSALLSLTNQNIVASGNDFALDDISFQQVCENSSSVVVTVSAGTPATPGTISGTTAQCPVLTSQIYSISPVTNATTYSWTVPTGWAITAGAGTTSVTVTTGSAGQNGNITVAAGNACGTSASISLAVTVNTLPNLAGLSTSATNTCVGNASVVTISATNLPNGTYTVNYTLTGANPQGATDATMIVSSGNSGTFDTPALASAGTTNLTINSLKLSGCATIASSGNTASISITIGGSWLGITSTDWHTVSNWCGGIPTTTTDVIIPSGGNQPVIGANAVCKNIEINSAASLTIAGSNTLTVSGNWTNNGTFTPNSSTVTFNSSGAVNISSSTFNNLIISGSGTKTETGNIVVNGNLTLNTGTFAISTSTTQTNILTVAGDYLQTGGVLDFNPTGYGSLSILNIAGNLTNSAGSSSITTNGAGAINGQIIFNGSSTQIINFSNSAASIWVTYTANTGSYVKLGSNITLTGDASEAQYYADFIVNGTIDFGTYILNDIPYGGIPNASHFDLKSGASLITANSNGISLSSNTGSVQFIGPRTYNGGANYTYNGVSSQISGNGLTSANNLTNSNSAGLTLSNDVAVTNTLTLTAGILTNNYKFTLKGALNFSNGAKINSSSASSTIEFAGTSAQSIPIDAFNNDQIYNLTINNANHVVLNGSLNLLNTLTVSSGRLNASTNTPNVIYTGASAQTIESNCYLNNEIYNLTINNGSGVALNSDFTINNNLDINSGKLFSLKAGKALTVSGTLTNSAGNAGFVLESDASGTASLLHNSNNVPATVKRYISSDAEAWHFISSPVTNQSISGSWLPSGTYGNATGYDLYLWNEPTFCWIYQLDATSINNWNTVHPSSNFMIGRGYLYSVQALNPTKDFVGNLNNGSISYGLTINGADVSLKGFNLVGNPYPSSIDWRSAAGWSRTNLVNSAGGYDSWIWNPAVNNYGVSNSFTGITTNGISQYIAPMQGFFVQAASAGNLSMNNSVRVPNGASNWFKSENQENQNLSLSVKSDSGYGSDEILLIFGYSENANGATKLFSNVLSAPSLYFSSGSKNLTVRYLTNENENPVVPLQFKAGKDGDYTINCDFDLNRFETVLLQDRKTEYMHDLKTINKYSFTSSVSDAPNRFVLFFKSITNYTNFDFPAGIYTDGSQLIIDLTLIDKETDLSVYNSMGELLLQQKLQGTSVRKFDLDFHTQILIVHLKNPDGSLSKKLLWGVN